MEMGKIISAYGLRVARNFTLTIGLLIALSSTSYAQNVSPSHVYQVVDNVVIELSLLNEANSSSANKDKNAPEVLPRKPRHVIQKAKEVLQKIQLLRKLNRLSENTIPNFPVSEVKPADVKLMVNRILDDLADLRDKFSVTAPASNAALATGKTPTDVYKHLQTANLLIGGLGIPKPVPNDVYRIALTIIGDLNLVREAQGKAHKLYMLATSSKGIKPKAVLEKSIELISVLKVKSETSGDRLKVPGGVIIPNMRGGKINPGHVQYALNNALAEIAAMKVAAGSTSYTVIAPPQSGKTPSDVYYAVLTALEIARGL